MRCIPPPCFVRIASWPTDTETGNCEVNQRAFWSIVTISINAVLSHELYKLPPEKLAELVFNTVTRESLIFGGVALTACLTIGFAWPVFRWIWFGIRWIWFGIRCACTYPARMRAKRQTEKAARERAEVARIGKLFEELRHRIAIRNGRDSQLMIPYDKQRGPFRPLRSLINWLGTSGGNYADAEAMTRVLALFGELDALGLVPGGIPQGTPPENDGLDLDWHTELGRIRNCLLEEGIEAARAKTRDWYGHLNPAPRDGFAPAVFNYGDSLEEAIAGRGRAEHRPLTETPEPPV